MLRGVVTVLFYLFKFYLLKFFIIITVIIIVINIIHLNLSLSNFNVLIQLSSSFHHLLLLSPRTFFVYEDYS